VLTHSRHVDRYTVKTANVCVYGVGKEGMSVLSPDFSKSNLRCTIENVIYPSHTYLISVVHDLFILP